MEGIEVKVTTDSGSTLGKMQCYGISRRNPLLMHEVAEAAIALAEEAEARETPHQPTIVFLEGFERPIPGSTPLWHGNPRGEPTHVCQPPFEHFARLFTTVCGLLSSLLW